MKRKRIISMILAIGMVLSLLPTPAYAADTPSPIAEGNYSGTHAAHTNCGTATEVATFDALQAALNTNANADIVVTGNITVTGTLTVNGTKHLYVEEGGSFTLERGTGFTGAMFDVGSGDTLILGSGTMRYDDSVSLEVAAQRGSYSVAQNGGELIIDGGASWVIDTSRGNNGAYVRGTSFGATDGKSAVFFDLNEDSPTYGQQLYYKNEGSTATDSLVTSSGTLNVWCGVTLRNNALRNAGGSQFGGAINGANNSKLNMYGGTITKCISADDADQGVGGAIYMGSESGSAANTVFNMYGGEVINNSSPGSYKADGGGIAIDRVTMNLYGGAVSYNHAGIYSDDDGGAGDGGGIMVRSESTLSIWNGSVDHNYAGGYGGGVFAWESTINIRGGSLVQNVASYGAGIGIATSSSDSPGTVNMSGGTVAYNEAILGGEIGGYGGGICAGSGNYSSNARLNLSGGTIVQNKALYGGGLAVYAGGGTYANLSGDFEMTGNFADTSGNGMYITNTSPANNHALVRLSGGARIDTNNPVFFENVCVGQVPVQVTDTLTTSGAAAIFEFSEEFWDEDSDDGYAHPEPYGTPLSIAGFEGDLDIQENKIALESSTWYLQINEDDGTLDLRSFADLPQYTIRNGRAVELGGKKYYKLYSSLADAFNDAADGDTLYIFYNTTITTPAVLEGKSIALLAESNSTASRAGMVANGSGSNYSFEEHDGYDAMVGEFLLHGSDDADTPQQYRYNVRNDYTVTLSSSLALGENDKHDEVTAQEGAIIVGGGAKLIVGDSGASEEGSLVFDGNLSYPKEGPMFRVDGAESSLTMHKGITIQNHSNYSEAHPGAIEVAGGSFTMNSGVTISGNVSPVAGAVYVAEDGSFTMNGGEITGNIGAMPRHGFETESGERFDDYDTFYWGQAKYYHGAGGVLNDGTFTMAGGEIAQNCGEYGGIANMRGTLELAGGSITGNHAHTGSGIAGSDCDLTITDYDDGAHEPRRSRTSVGAGSGGGVYIGSGSEGASIGAVDISDNTAELNGGGIALGVSADLTPDIDEYSTFDGAQETVSKVDTVTVPGQGATLAGAAFGAGERFVISSGSINVLTANNGGTDVTNTNIGNNAANVTANMLWQVTASGSSYHIYNAETNRYLTLSSNNAGLSATAQAITFNNNRLSGGGYYLRYYNGNWTGSGQNNATTLTFRRYTPAVAESTVSTVTTVQVDASVPVYTYSEIAENADLAVDVSGAKINNNAAGEMGGGVYSSARSMTINAGTELTGNTAKNGGGIAADSAGSSSSIGEGGYVAGSATVRFYNNVTRNTATGSGGGVYVHGSGATVIAGGSLLDNTAAINGGGAALAPIEGESGGEKPNGGTLVLSGAFMSGNLVGSGGLGAGVYSDGTLVIAAQQQGAVQPRIGSYDVLYLAKNRVITTDAYYNIAAGQNGEVLTVDSEETANGTAIFDAENTVQAGTLVSHATHLRGNLSRRATGDDTIVEINSVFITYWDADPKTEDESGEHIATPSTFGVAPNARVTAYNFAAASVDAAGQPVAGFAIPEEGQILSGWLLAKKTNPSDADEAGVAYHYINEQGEQVNTAVEIQPGNDLPTNIGDFYLIADYDEADFYVYYLEKGADGDNEYEQGTQGSAPNFVENEYRYNHLGSLYIPGTDYNGANARYVFVTQGKYGNNIDNSLVLTPTPVTPDAHGIQGVLQEFSVYSQVDTAGENEEATADERIYNYFSVHETDKGYTSDYEGGNNDNKWIKTFSATVDSATGEIVGITTYKYTTDGGEVSVVPNAVDAAAEGTTEVNIPLPDGTATTATISADGRSITYKQPADSILVLTHFKQAMVELSMINRRDDTPVHLGYYDTHHAAFGAMVAKYREEYIPGAAVQQQIDSTVKLLAAYKGELTDTSTEPGGDKGVVDMAMTGVQSELNTDLNINYTLDINGFTMDMGKTPQLMMQGISAAIKNGVIRQSVNTDEEGNVVESAFDLSEGEFTVENVRIVTVPGGEGTEGTKYSIKVGTGGKLHIRSGCELGNIYLAEGEDAGGSSTDAVASVGGDFDTSSAATVATIYIDGTKDTTADGSSDESWDYANGERVVFVMEGVSSVKGSEIRERFELADAAAINNPTAFDNSTEWFIGTDGSLHRKVMYVEPQLVCGTQLEDGEQHEEILTKYDNPSHDHDYGNGPRFNESGYPVFGEFIAQFGFSVDDHMPQFDAVLYDPQGNEMPELDSGEMRFLVNTYRDNRQARLFGFSAAVEDGRASTQYPDMASADATTDIPYYISVTWFGDGEYSSQYAQYWNYNYSKEPDVDEVSGGVTIYDGINDATLSGVVELHMSRKPMSDETVRVEYISPSSAEYIGPKGAALGYTSAPTLGSIRDVNTDRLLISGTDYTPYYVALTTDPNEAIDPNEPLTTADGVYYYLDGGNDEKVYYTNSGGTLNVDGREVTALSLNGADVGLYSAELNYVEGTNYEGLSGWKGATFEITRYADRLIVDAENSVVIEDGDFAAGIRALFSSNPPNVTDYYGNVLDLSEVSISFETLSGTALLDANGLPAAAGLYNIVATANGHANGSLKLMDDSNSTTNPNYCDDDTGAAAVGYIALLVMTEHPEVFIIPETVEVPYTGEIYTDDMVKDYGGYAIWKLPVDERGNPVDKDSAVLDLETATDEQLIAAGGVKLDKTEYRLELGTPQHVPRDADTYAMIVTDTSGSYSGIGHLEISRVPITSAVIEPDAAVYTGQGHMPAITVTDAAGRELTANTDYVVTVRQVFGEEGNETLGPTIITPRAAGKYRYTVTGINNYEGSYNLDYTVNPKMLDNSDNTEFKVSLVAVEDVFYSGAEVVPSVSLYYNGAVLVADTDYRVETSETLLYPRDLPYQVTIKGTGNYAGETSFGLTIHSPAQAGRMNFHIPGTYYYNGGAMSTYRWENSASLDLDGTIIDLERCDITVWTGIDMEDESNRVPDDQVVDAGVYFIRAIPDEDYDAYLSSNLSGYDSGDYGVATIYIQPAEVEITMVPPIEKTYGENDPTNFAYTTDIESNAGAGEGNFVSGFYSHDANRIGGSFSRDPGEDVRAIGYHFAIGTFTAGSNYIITIGAEGRFRITPKNIADDDVAVDYRPTLGYTGYGMSPIDSVTYAAPILGSGVFNLYEDAQYVTIYQRWECPTHVENGAVTCTPHTCDLTDEEWEENWGDPSELIPSEVGWYRITLDADGISGTNNYTGSRSDVIYQIAPTVGELDIEIIGGDTVTYTGVDRTPGVTVRSGGFSLSPEDYILSYTAKFDDGSPSDGGLFPPQEGREFVKAGTYTIIATGVGNYASSGEATFVIEPKSLAEGDTDGAGEVSITLAETEFTYNGSSQQAEVTATYAGMTLTDADFDLSYENHLNAGSATVTVTGTGNYTGSRELAYTILQKQLTVTVTNASKTYGDIEPVYEYVLTDENGSTVTDVALTGTIVRESGEDAGEYDFLAIEENGSTLSAGSNYKLSLATAQFTIEPKPLGDGAPAEKISVSAPTRVAVGSTPDSVISSIGVTYWAATETKTLAYGEDFIVTILDKNGTEFTGEELALGSYTAVITAGSSGNYVGEIRQSFTVVDADAFLNITIESVTDVYAGPVGIPVELTAQLGSGGGDVAASFEVTGPNFSKTVSSSETTPATVTVVDAGTYTVTATYSGSTTATGTATIVIRQKNIGELIETGALDSYPYTGDSVVIPDDVLNGLLTHGKDTDNSDYKLVATDDKDFYERYANNVKPGTASVTLYGIGNFTGSKTLEFTIDGSTLYSIVYDGNNATSGAAPVDNSSYFDKAVTYAPNGGSLTRGTDIFYGWSYTQVIDAVEQSAGLPTPFFPEGGAITVDASRAVNGIITLYAVWAADDNGDGTPDLKEDRYGVSYNPGSGTPGGAPIDAKTYLPKEMVVVLEAPNLMKDGYALRGWNLQGSEAVLDTSTAYLAYVANIILPEMSFLMGSEDVELFPVWVKDSDGNGTPDWEETESRFYIYYDGNGGAGSFPPTVLEPNEQNVRVSANSFERQDYVQVGWTSNGNDSAHPGVIGEAPSPDSNGLITVAEKEHYYVGFGEVYEITEVNESHDNPVIFYALWAEDKNNNDIPDYSENSYAVSYANNASEVASDMPEDNNTYVSGSMITLADAPTGTYSDGGTKTAQFLGWTTDSSASKLYGIGEAVKVGDGEAVYAAGQSVPAPHDAPSADGEAVVFYAMWGVDGYDRTVLFTVNPPAASEYSGNEQPPVITVMDGSYIVDKAHYTVSYSRDGAVLTGNPIDAGTYAVTVTGNADTQYEGRTATVYYVITSAELTVIPSASGKTYGELDPELTFTVTGKPTSGAAPNYAGALTRAAGEDVGDYYVVLATLRETSGNYTLTLASGAKFAIAPKDIAEMSNGADYDVTIAPLSAQLHTGEAVVPALTIIYPVEGRVFTLEGGKDYTVSYAADTSTGAELDASGNPLEVGTYTVTVTGKGNYTGERTVTFEITDDGVLTMADRITVTYTGRALDIDGETDLEVKYDGETADADKYTVTYAVLSGGELEQGLPRDAGVYTVTVTGNSDGEYDGLAAYGTLIVEPAEIDTVEIDDDASVEIAPDGSVRMRYNGEERKPEIASVKSGDITLGTADYDVTYRTAAGVVSTAAPTDIGSYTIVVTGKGNFAGSKEIALIIYAGSLTVGSVDGSVYDGMPYTPVPSVTSEDLSPVLNEDYTLAYAPLPPINAGSYTVTVSGRDNFADFSAELDYVIAPKALDNTDGSGMVSVAAADAVYTGDECEPTVIVTYMTEDGRTLYLIEDTDYTVEYENNTLVGAATVTVTAVSGSNYSKSAQATFRVLPAAGKSLAVSVDPMTAVYTGSELTPTVTVTVKNGTQLTEGTDYTVTYVPVDAGASLGSGGKPLTVGAYTVSVVGMGETYADYVGSATFVITPAPLVSMTLSGTTFDYTGSAHKPLNKVYIAGGVEVSADNCEVIYENNTNAGTATVTVVGINNCSGVLSKTFEIKQVALTIAPYAAEKTYGENDPDMFDYEVTGADGTAVNVTLTGSLTREAGEDADEYAFLLGSLRDESGNYTVDIAADAPKFKITPKNIKDSNVFKPQTLSVVGDDFEGPIEMVYNSARGNLLLEMSKDYTLDIPALHLGENTVTIDAVEGGNYTGTAWFTLIVKSQNLDASLEETHAIYDGKSFNERIGFKVTNDEGKTLTNGTDYTYAITPDANIIDVGAYTFDVDGKGVYATESDTVTFFVYAKDIASTDITAETISARPYTGDPHEPNVVLEFNDMTLVPDKDYTVAYANNVNAGTATVTITGIGNYTGTRTETFTISPAELTVGALNDVTYNGMPQAQKPTVTGIGGEELTENVDYTLSYSGNTTNAGTVTVTVTGIGNYAGSSGSAEYKILKGVIVEDWIDLPIDELLYNGEELEPGVFVANGSIRLIEGTDYELTYSDNTEAGTATVTVTGKGNYEGSPDVTFTIAPDAEGLIVSVNPETVTYNGESQTPTLTVNALTADDYTATYSFNGVDKGSFDGAQFVDVGVYVINVSGTNSYEGAAGTAVFTILASDFTVDEIGGEERVHNGTPFTPSVTVRPAFDRSKTLESTDYDVFYSNNVLPGTATVTVVGKGNYAGYSHSVTFTIYGSEPLTVTYHANGADGGDVPTDAKVYRSGDTVTVMSGTLTRTGADFLGWVADENPALVDGSASGYTIYEAGKSFAISNSVELYALWGVKKLTITTDAGEGGTITPTATVRYADDFTVTITVEDDYTLSGVTVDGSSIDVSTLTKNGDDYTYTFSDVTANHTIIATFSKTVNVGGGGGGGGGSGGGGGTPDSTPDPDNPPDDGGSTQPTLIRDKHFAYVQGKGDGFDPNGTMTRAEVATILVRLMTGTMEIPSGYETSFPDVEPDAWYHDAIAYLEQFGILNGYPDGTFRPNEPITRAELAAMMMRFFEVEDWTGEPIFSDLPETHWAYDYINSAHAYGFVLGYTDGTFAPDRYIRRAEAVALINRVLERVADIEFIDEHIESLITYPDVEPLHWAYYDIIEASNGHDFTYGHGEDDYGDEEWLGIWPGNVPPTE